MIVSLNEIEAIVVKACRGAGMSWGIAEEAAQAARWLASRELPWAASLANLLSCRGELSPPDLIGNELRPAEPMTDVCSIHAGVAVSDLLSAQGYLVLQHVREPLWLLPLAMRHATAGEGVTLSWAGGRTTSAAGPTHDFHAFTVGRVARISVELLPGAELPGAIANSSRVLGVSVDDSIWQRLDRLAALTYVPASDQSRVAGAGAGLLDND